MHLHRHDLEAGVMGIYADSEQATLDALALEYQRDYGTARGNLNITDLVNNPFVNSPLSIQGLSLQEKLGNLLGGQGTILSDNLPDAPLVAH